MPFSHYTVVNRDLSFRRLFFKDTRRSKTDMLSKVYAKTSSDSSAQLTDSRVLRVSGVRVRMRKEAFITNQYREDVVREPVIKAITVFQ